MTDHHTVADAIAELLIDRGVSIAFGIPGVHNLPFWDSDSDLRVIGVRHEQAAAYAADGLFRATGQPSAALVTSGPGAANTAAAFGEAHAAGSAVVVIASDVAAATRRSDGPRGILHEMADQAGLFRAFDAPAWSAFEPNIAVDAAAAAIDTAIAAPPKPTAVNVATDVLGAPWNEPIPTRSRSTVVEQSTDDIDRLEELIDANPHIVLWIGGGVVTSDTEQLVVALAERLQAPIVVTYAAKGVAAGHPLLVDMPPHEPEVADVIGSADLLIGIGSDFDGMNTRNWRMPVPRRIAAIALGDQIARTFDWDVLVQADLRIVLPDLIGRLDSTERESWCTPADIRPSVLARLRADDRMAPAVEFVETVNAAWPRDGVVVCDMAVSAYWYGGYASQPRPRRVQYPVGWGTLGYALPAAIGPAVAGIPTLVVCGDGGPMFALGELATYSQERLPITLLVDDDGGYGMLRFDQRTFGHPERGVDLITPDWFHLGSAFGIDVVEVNATDELPGALARAEASNRQGQPCIVVHRSVFHPPRTTSPRWFEKVD